METYARDHDSERYQCACDWFVRLRESADASGVVAEWLAWCARDPANREVFEQVRRDWTMLGLVPRGPLEASPPVASSPASSAAFVPQRRPGPSGSMLRKAAGLTGLALFAGSLWLYWNGSPSTGSASVLSLTTAPTEHRTVRLNDGSLVDIAGDSRLTVHMSAHRRDIELARGEAFFTVAHDRSRPFVVRAGALSVRAVGTRFDVRTTDARVVVAVEEGVVEVEPPRNAGAAATQATAIRSGQEVAVVSDEDLQILPIEPAAVASWRQGRLRFVREPLKSVVESIRAVSGKQIEIAAPEIGDLRFTGTVFSSGVDAWVMALPAVFPVDVHSDGAKLIITHRVEPGE